MRALYIYFVCLFLILSSCAQIVAPAGGPVDTKQPKVDKTIPFDTSVNFRSQSILIFFDEYITLKNNSNLLISPPQKQKPELKVKKKTLEIIFKEPLKENTTYQLTLPDMIADITEGNTLPMFSYIFSTGPELDSGFIKGKLTESYTGQPIANAIVALYETKPDTAIIKNFPSYITKSKSDGSYDFKCLRNSSYHIVSYNDANSNLTPEITELFGFYAHLVSNPYKDTTYSLLMSYMRNKEREFLADCKKINANQVLLTSNLSEALISIKNFTPQTQHFYITGKRNDSLFIFTLQDKFILFNDSVLNCSDTTKKTITVEPVFNPSYILPEDTLTFKTAKELSLDTSKIRVLIDSVRQNISIKNFPFSIYSTWKEDNNYILEIDSGAFFNADKKVSNDAISIRFKPHSFEESSEISFTINNKTKAQLICYLQREDKQYNTVKSFIQKDSSQVYNYKNIQPGTYRIKAILDQNNNGRYDEGDFIQWQIPETIFFSQPIELKANWQVNDVIIHIE